MSSLKCLFVDWHNTLSNSLFWEHLSDPSHARHYFLAPITSVLFGNPNTYSVLLEPWMRGSLTSEEVVDLICQETQFNPSFVLSELVLSCQRMQSVSPAIPQYIANLRAKGVTVVVATDNMDTFVRWTAPSLQLGALFDDILCSSEVKGLKSDVDEAGRSVFFTNYLHDHHIGWGESLLLDDEAEQFGSIIQQFGIEYYHVEPKVGLISALQAVMMSLP